MSVCLQFDGRDIVPFAERDDVQAVADWAAECEEYAPDVLKLFEDGESHDIGGLTEQIARAKACNAPDERTGRHVVKLLRTLEESNALSVDLVEDDEPTELTKTLAGMQASIESLTAKMQAGPQPVLNVTVPEIEMKLSDNPFGDGFQKSLHNAVQSMAQTLASVLTQTKAAVVNVEPTPINMPVPVLSLDTSIGQAFGEAVDRIVAAIGSIKLVVNVPPPKPCGIAVTRDSETGLATRFDPVEKE